MRARNIATVTAAAFISCILAANYVTTEYGMVPVGFGLAATAGTYLAGLTFVLRDTLQDALRQVLRRKESRTETIAEPAYPDWATEAAPQLRGLMRKATVRRVVEVEPPHWLVALALSPIIVLGAALSFLISDPFIALASGVAFLVSELADLAVYTPLRKRGYIRAAVASNIVGALVDTVLFLWIAGFPIADAVAGQMVGKLLVTLAVVVAVIGARVAVSRESVRA